MKRKAILVEFNELSPTLMQQFIGEGKLPNFKRLFDESIAYVTDAEEAPPSLEPWIQWVTVHSGMAFKDHKVFDLGEGHKLKEKCLWDVVADAGQRSWVCGAMNSRADKSPNITLLPDPWTVGTMPQPESMLPYFRFVQRHVQEHTNAEVKFSGSDYFRFLRFMFANGLSFTSIWTIVKQLVSERFMDTGWKRATILDKLQFDVFKSIFRREKPALSVFFANSTAHYQHKFWRNMSPAEFKLQPSEGEQRVYKDAILFGYQQMDALIGRFSELVEDDTALIFASALSQKPCLAYEDQGGKSFYRPRDFGEFAKLIGLPGSYEISPVMSEEFHVFFSSESEAREGAARLSGLTVNGRKVMKVKFKDREVFSGCEIFDSLPADARLRLPNGLDVAFKDVFYHVESIKSGMHHPDGIFWIRLPEAVHEVHRDKIPLTRVAAMILETMGLPVPQHMRPRAEEPARGYSTSAHTAAVA